DSGWGRDVLPGGLKGWRTHVSSWKHLAGKMGSTTTVVLNSGEEAIAFVHHHAIRFKMDNKKHIVNLESFKDMLHICPRIHGQSFVEPPFEEEILAFVRFLGHSAVEHKVSKKSNEMYYPRFMKVIIHYFMLKDPSIPRRNKVNWHYVRDDHMFSTIKLELHRPSLSPVSGKTRSSFDTTITPPTATAGTRLTTSAKGKQAAKASKAKSLYALTEFSAMLPIELTNKDIRNSVAYKEYYAIASRAAPPKTKASVRKTQSSSDTTMPPPTAAGIRLSTSAKGKQPAKSSKAKDEGTGIIPGVPDVPTFEFDEEISWKSSDEDDDVDDQSDAAADDDDDDQEDEDEQDDDDQEDEDEQDDDDQDDNDDDQDSDNDGDDFVHPKLSTHDKEAKDEESFDPIIQTPSHVDNFDDESHGMNVGETKDWM
nr:hypothetical protein [Tanacetum cinerariifolium]